VRATPSPNIWRHPDRYEQLNLGADPEGLLLAALDELLGERAPVAVALDVGCGTGFWLPRLASRARRVHGVEPHPDLAERARTRVRCARLEGQVVVHTALAQRLPLPDDCADLVFSHWAYFFGPGCEPGLAEADRVLRTGGAQVVVDLDVESDRGYARWFAASGRAVRADRAAAFFAIRGFRTRRLPVVWQFADRAELAEVLALEFPPRVAARALAETVGSTVAVPTVLRWRRNGGAST
jgi:SAM-dependent methyltransferase